MSLDVSPEVENAIRRRADALGVSTNELLAQVFVSGAAEPPPASDPMAHAQAMLARWRAEDNTPTPLPNRTQPGESPTRALFRKWEEEDARMTEDERAAEDQLWEEIGKSLSENRLVPRHGVRR